jgi:cellulose biosynthesis protein BcsQ
MLGVIDEVRTDVREGNPFLQILGVLPTMFDQRWPDHRLWHKEMVDVCRERQVHTFPPIPRRQSYTRLSVAGHDYRPVADAIRELVTRAELEPRA